MQKMIEGFRLSLQQARTSSFQAQSNVHRAECAVLLEGPLDVRRLRDVFEQILLDHEIYRTRFLRLPGMKTPVQYIQDDPAYIWREIDISSCLPEQQQQLQTALLLEERAYTFEDAGEEALLRCSLIDLGQARRLLQIHTSALRADIPTLRKLVHDLANLYLREPGENGLIDQDGQYIQFSEWQHQLLLEENAEQPAWIGEDGPSLSAISLPCEKRGREPGCFAPALLGIQLETHQFERLNTWLARQQHTLAEFLLACWLVLLSRQTGNNELVIGVGIDGRIYEELAGIAGPMVKYLPMRQRLAEGQTFNELLADIQAAHAELSARYPYFSWDMAPSSDIPPWYAFCFEAYDQVVPVRGKEITFGLERCYSCSEPYKFKLLVTGSWLEWQYDANLFQEQDVRCLAQQFLTLIEAAVEQAEIPVGSLPLLSQDERASVLKTFHQQRVPYPQDACLHHLFEWQVEKTPDAVAVQYADECLTYELLNAQANQLAHYLSALNVGPEVTVGLYLERSSTLLIAILAILKAGGAYVPLDPLYPAERRAYIADNAQLSLLLTSSKLQASAPRLAGEIAVLEQIWPVVARLDAHRAPPAAVGPENLAYVLYTSGSTGQPKGVMIPHRGVVHYIHWCSTAYQVANGSGAPLHSPLAFDLTVTSLFAPLSVGQRLVLVSEEEGIEALSKLLRLNPHFSLLKITPAHLELVTRSLNLQELATVADTVVIGGEALYGEHVALWREHAPQVRLINEYGPTETVVGCCVYEVAGDAPTSGNLPIGHPLPNTGLYVLDKQFQPVAIGLSGEIYISGIGVGRGYLRRPELTAERFLPDLYSTEPGARMYRTGDLGRYCSASGDREYLGRADRQVKLRGFRIELEEIEAVLLRQPQVQEAVVLLREDEPGKPQLVAYLVSVSRPAPSLAELQEALQLSLPRYMLPSAMVLLKSLPLTPNGKLDRDALPPPERVEPAAAFVSPEGLIEEVIADIWEDILETQPISIHDNFFALGGHSLLATRFIARLHHLFQIELPLADLFAAPTVAGLARKIESLIANAQPSGRPALQPIARDGLLPLSFAQQRLWFLDQLEPENTAYLIASAHRLRGALVYAALEQSLGALINRHEILRTTFAQHANQPVQVVHPARAFCLPVVDLRGLGVDQRRATSLVLAQQEESLPCNLFHGPLLRLTLLILDQEEHILLVTMHHIISDAWSNTLFLQEANILYQAEIEGRPPALAPLPVQYADFAAWQRQWLQGEVLETQLAYWKRQLTGSSTLELPTDRPRQPLQTFNGALATITIPQPLQAQLQALSQQQGATLFITMLAAFQVMLALYSGQTDISVGTPIANRRFIEVENLLGIFVNTLVLRTDLSGNLSFLEALKRVREVALNAYAHQDLPFEQLVDELLVERDLSRSPLFQVMFVLQHAKKGTGIQARPESLKVQSMELPQKTAKFDMTLFVTSTPDAMECTIEYNTDLFEAATMARWFDHWRLLLEGIVAHPEKSIHAHTLLTPAEQQLLQSWETSVAPAGMPDQQVTSVHGLFEAQAEQTPDAIAVAGEQEMLSYGALNRLANQLANYLCLQGSVPGLPIGICLDRSLLMTIAMLGILKAGGAYLPLDPAYPGERLSYMLENAQVPLILSHSARQLSVESADVRLIPLDQNWQDVGRQKQTPAWQWSEPATLAYVIYTSGSTGLPKGIAMPHCSLVRLLTWQRQTSLALAGTRTLQFASLSFDVAFQECFATWSTGGTLYLIDETLHKDPFALVHILDQAAIERLFLPFVALQQLTLAAAQTEIVPAYLREVITAGEQLQITPPVQAFFQKTGSAFYNQYGPAESHVVTAFSLAGRPEEWPPLPSIGRPVTETRIYLLNAQLQRVPPGSVGELCISGASLAHGYLRAPDMTAERFLPNPWSGEAGDRLYRTGDLARYGADGNLLFLGRRDHQVKVRGQRVELGEIEVALSQHAQVRACAVILHKEQLLAFLVLQEGAHLELHSLRPFLQQSLPDVMIPAHFVPLEELPLTPSGKVDRQALLSLQIPGDRQDYERPRDETEAQLQLIWQEVLNVISPGIFDNFFALGGHSILAVNLVARLRERFRQDLALATLFLHPTIAEQAALLRQGIGVARQTVLVPLHRALPRSQRPPFFCMHPVGGTVFRYYRLAQLLGDDQPFYGLQMPELESDGATYTRLEDLASYYIRVIQEVQPQGPYLLGGWSMGGVIAFEMAQQLRAAGQVVALVALLDSVVENFPDLPCPARGELDITDDALIKAYSDYYAIAISDEDSSQYSEGERLQFVVAHLKTLGIIPTDLDLTQARHMMLMHRVNLYAFETYIPQLTSQALTLFRAEEGVSPEDPAKPDLPRGRQLARGWETLTTGGLAIYPIPGNHSTILDEPHVRVLAAQLRKCLDQSSGFSSGDIG